LIPTDYACFWSSSTFSIERVVIPVLGCLVHSVGTLKKISQSLPLDIVVVLLVLSVTELREHRRLPQPPRNEENASD
jgi:hypothetical protein